MTPPEDLPAAGPPPSTDVYFSVDVETDGSIPGPYSMLSFAIVEAGRFDGAEFRRAEDPKHFYAELRPISDRFEADALAVNGLDRDRLAAEGEAPERAMKEAATWIDAQREGGEPVLVAYPLAFDWLWMHWYFMKYLGRSPFKHSRAFDLKTAFAVKGRRTIGTSGRSRVPPALAPKHPHTHNALDDARSQAELFANLFEWNGE